MSVVEAGMKVSAVEETACPLCSAESAHDGHREPLPADRRDQLLPWAIALTTGVLLASVGIGSDRWFGIGAVMGLLAGGGLALQSVRTAVRERQAEHDRVVRELNNDADGRVQMVIRQFEWAVNDVAKLTRDQERAQVTADLLVVQGRARERHVRKLERQILEAREREAMRAAAPRSSERAEFEPASDDRVGAVRVSWGLHHDGQSTLLELECDSQTYRPKRLRVVDPTGAVCSNSMTAMHSGDGSLCFALAEPPAELLADLVAGRAPRHQIEAQYDYEWRAVRLEDTGRRTRIVMDRHGREFRVTDAPHRMPLSVLHNPFDHSSDSAFVTL